MGGPSVKSSREKTWTWYLVTRVLIAGLLGIVSGMVHGWASPVIAKLSKDTADNPLGRAITTVEKSWIGSLVSLGAVVGPFIAGFFSDKIGRKFTLIGIAIGWVISFTIFAFATEIYWYYIGRFIAGISFGGHYTVLPVYLVEISGNTNRGIVGTSAIVLASLGQFLAVAIGPFVSIMIFNLIILVLPVCFIILFFIFNPETPLYLLKKNREEQAKIVYDNFRQTGNYDDFEEMKAIVNDNTNQKSIKELFQKKYIKVVAITTILVCFKPLTGVNTIGVYAQNIFETLNTGMSSDVAPIVIGAVLIVASFITPIYVERIGRKILLMISSAGIVIAELVLGFYYLFDTELVDHYWLPVACLFCVMLFYGCGFGSVVWTVMSELLPSNIKSPAAAIANCFCWLLNFLASLLFPIISDAFGEAVAFWIFAGFNFIALIFTFFFIPETRGVSTKDAQELLV